MGLSWLRTRHGDRTVVRHGGNVSLLQMSEFITVPDDNLAVTVLTNSGGGGEGGRAVVQWCLEHAAEIQAMSRCTATTSRRPANTAARNGRNTFRTRSSEAGRSPVGDRCGRPRSTFACYASRTGKAVSAAASRGWRGTNQGRGWVRSLAIGCPR